MPVESGVEPRPGHREPAGLSLAGARGGAGLPSGEGEHFWTRCREEGGAELPPHHGGSEGCVMRAPSLFVTCLVLFEFLAVLVKRARCVCFVYLGLLLG